VVRRSLALIWLTVAVVPAFGLTTAITRVHRAHLSRLAAEWSAHGERALEDGAAADAITDFRNALSYDGESRPLRLRLAQALAAADRRDEALGYLSTLWDDEPGNGPVNLELARIYARSGDTAHATRYYHGAIEGAWPDDAERRRRGARLELANLLVASGDLAHAEPELVALASNLPSDPAALKQIAGLLQRAGLVDHARRVLLTVLKENPRDPDALGALGELAFQQRDFATAARYLERAAATTDESTVRRDARIARLVLDSNPYQRRLTRTERARRAHQAFASAQARLASCSLTAPGDSTLDGLRARGEALQHDAAEPHLRADSDAIDAAMEFTFDAEAATAARCGQAEGMDRALQLLGEVRRGER
jgi:tetratricopeptide (TPR) repeat protein